MFLYGTNSLWAARQGIAELRTAQAWSDLRRELRELTWHHKVSFFISKRLSTCWPTMFIRPFCPYHVKGPWRVRISGWWWWYEASTLTLTRPGFIWFWTDEKDQKWFSLLVWTIEPQTFAESIKPFPLGEGRTSWIKAANELVSPKVLSWVYAMMFYDLFQESHIVNPGRACKT